MHLHPLFSVDYLLDRTKTGDGFLGMGVDVLRLWVDKSLLELTSRLVDEANIVLKPTYTLFFIRNDKMASSTRSFLIFTPFLVPKMS